MVKLILDNSRQGFILEVKKGFFAYQDCDVCDKMLGLPFFICNKTKKGICEHCNSLKEVSKEGHWRGRICGHLETDHIHDKVIERKEV